jgi:hypothetical protein
MVTLDIVRSCQSRWKKERSSWEGVLSTRTRQDGSVASAGQSFLKLDKEGKELSKCWE